MAYIEKEIGEKIIERIYKKANTSKNTINKIIEEKDIKGYNTSFLRGIKKGIDDILKIAIAEIRELEDE